jgi:hypothetical protein
MGSWSVTNLLAAGAHERTPRRIALMPAGATGFKQPGDSMCWKIKVILHSCLSGESCCQIELTWASKH